jgi:hypothetical protein
MNVKLGLSPHGERGVLMLIKLYKEKLRELHSYWDIRLMKRSMVRDKEGKGNGVDDMILTQIWKEYECGMASSGLKDGDAANSCKYGNPPLFHKRWYMSWSADRLSADQGELGRTLLRKNATLMSLTCITLFVSATNNASLQLTRFHHVLRTCTRMCSIVNTRKVMTDISSLY